MLETRDVMRDALADLLQGESMYAAVVDGDGHIAGILSIEIISEFLASPEAKTDEHCASSARSGPNARARSPPMNSSLLGVPIAAVGEVGEGFFKERTGGRAASKTAATSSAATGRVNTSAATARRPFSSSKWWSSRWPSDSSIAFALALLARRFRYLEPPLLAGTGILFAIPSVAFFLLLLPITGRGRETAIVALSAYTLQIIYRNVMVGLHNVPESARTRRAAWA